MGRYYYRICFRKEKVQDSLVVLETDYKEVAMELVKMLREKYPADRFYIVEMDERIVNYE